MSNAVKLYAESIGHGLSEKGKDPRLMKHPELVLNRSTNSRRLFRKFCAYQGIVKIKLIN